MEEIFYNLRQDVEFLESNQRDKVERDILFNEDLIRNTEQIKVTINEHKK